MPTHGAAVRGHGTTAPRAQALKRIDEIHLEFPDGTTAGILI